MGENMESYNPQKLEKKWQRFWDKNKIFEAKNNSKKPKFYILDMFPYPSGSGLHVGHPRGYIGSDIIAHYMRMRGYNVLHPMGWDAFGLPAENYAIKTGIHPEITTRQNIKRFKGQMEKIGLSYDWGREISTCDPNYYKWTQWIFLKLFERGLAYRKKLPINWCPSCKTGLANEEVISGKCERCGSSVAKKDVFQWVLKITEYSEKLLKGLDDLDWPEKIKEMQRNWIGKSEGALIKFEIKDQNEFIDIFTTRPDTVFGATFLVLAPEHALVEKIASQDKLKEIHKYRFKTNEKSDVERQAETKDKTGVFIGNYAINPANNKKIPIYIADYVLPLYGYGAIMAVPGHDKRDYEFAKKYNLPIVEVIKPVKFQIPNLKFQTNSKFKIQNFEQFNKVYDGEGELVNSGGFDGMDSIKAKKEIIKWLVERGLAKEMVNYKLRDWIFSRQRYWGEPIPLVFCQNCAKKIQNSKCKSQSDSSKCKIKFNKGELLNPGWVAMPEKELPLKLPKIEKYEPTGTGDSPLALEKKWLETACPKCGNKARRETNTMPQWAGSCWYFLAYVMQESKSEKRKTQSKKNKLKDINFGWNKENIQHWLPVDFYVGGAEHAVLHLLYSRFWIKALYDAGVISFDEPFLKLKTIGLILAPDGQKMSKSRGNVINPDEIIEKYGADAFRIYEMFMGPFDQPISWDLNGILGAQRFLQKAWRLFEKREAQSEKLKPTAQNSKLNKLLHKTIKKVTEDIEAQKFNTAIARMMELVNEMDKEKELSVISRRLLVKLLAPLTPHLAEELWYGISQKPKIKNQKHKLKIKKFKSVFEEKWPSYDPKLIENENMVLVVQINGKMRDQIEALFGISKKDAQEIVLKSEKIQKWIAGKEIKKIIFVPNKLINFVV